jgi:hypothetical protein
MNAIWKRRCRSGARCPATLQHIANGPFDRHGLTFAPCLIERGLLQGARGFQLDFDSCRGTTSSARALAHSREAGLPARRRDVLADRR